MDRLLRIRIDWSLRPIRYRQWQYLTRFRSAWLYTNIVSINITKITVTSSINTSSICTRGSTGVHSKFSYNNCYTSNGSWLLVFKNIQNSQLHAQMVHFKTVPAITMVKVKIWIKKYRQFLRFFFQWKSEWTLRYKCSLFTYRYRGNRWNYIFYHGEDQVIMHSKNGADWVIMHSKFLMRTRWSCTLLIFVMEEFMIT